MPPSLRTVDIVVRDIAQPIHSERLPRDLRFLRLSSCRIYGTLDLSSFPSDVVQVHLSSNRIQGTLSLLNLPYALEVIDLENNALRGLVWNKADLSPLFREAYFSLNSKMTCTNIGGKDDREPRLKFTRVPKLPVCMEYFDSDFE